MRGGGQGPGNAPPEADSLWVPRSQVAHETPPGTGSLGRPPAGPSSGPRGPQHAWPAEELPGPLPPQAQSRGAGGGLPRCALH